MEGNNITLSGSDLTQAGTFNVILTATASGGKTIELPFTVIARNCTPVGLAATPSTLAITQLQAAPTAISLSQTAAPSQCGFYSFSITTNNFTVLNGATITLNATLGTVIQAYQIVVTSTMIDVP